MTLVCSPSYSDSSDQCFQSRLFFPPKVIRHSNSDTNPHELHHEGPINAMKDWLSARVSSVPGGKIKLPAVHESNDLLPRRPTKSVLNNVEGTTTRSKILPAIGRQESSAKEKKEKKASGPTALVRPSPSLEALASKKKLGGGVEVFSGSLGQVVLVPFAFNVSSERRTRLEANTMLFRQLQQQVRDTRAYLASVQPDFDVNAGACRCGRSISTECSCCAKLTMKRFLMESRACVNFTYVLKDHVLRVRLGYERQRIAERTLAAATPPMLCAGQTVDLCSAFRNVTYKVQLDSVDHKTSLSGCLDLIMRLKTRPIAIYPMGCFHLGRDPKLVHIDKLNNWMP